MKDELLAFREDFTKSIAIVTSAYCRKLYQQMQGLVDTGHGIIKTKELRKCIDASYCNPSFSIILGKRGFTSWLENNLSNYNQDFLIELKAFQAGSENIFRLWVNPDARSRDFVELKQAFLNGLENLPGWLSSDTYESRRRLSTGHQPTLDEFQSCTSLEEMLEKLFNQVLEKCDEYTQILSRLPKFKEAMDAINQYHRAISILRDTYCWHRQLLLDIDSLQAIIQRTSLGCDTREPAHEKLQAIQYASIETLNTDLKQTIHHQPEGFRHLISKLSEQSLGFTALTRECHSELQKKYVAGMITTIDHDCFNRADTYYKLRKQLETLLEPWEIKMNNTQLTPLRETRQHIKELTHKNQQKLEALKQQEQELNEQQERLSQWGETIKGCESTCRQSLSDLEVYYQNKLHTMEAEHDEEINRMKKIYKAEITELDEQQAGLKERIKEENEYILVQNKLNNSPTSPIASLSSLSSTEETTSLVTPFNKATEAHSPRSGLPRPGFFNSNPNKQASGPSSFSTQNNR